MNKNTVNKVFSSLLKLYPNPKTELKYINKFTFLISVVLSAQATDVSVNIATKELFKINNGYQKESNLGRKDHARNPTGSGCFNEDDLR